MVQCSQESYDLSISLSLGTFLFLLSFLYFFILIPMFPPKVGGFILYFLKPKHAIKKVFVMFEVLILGILQQEVFPNF